MCCTLSKDTRLAMYPRRPRRVASNRDLTSNEKSEHGRVALLRDHGYLGSVPINH